MKLIAGFSIVVFMLGFVFMFIALWMILSAYFFAVGLAGFIPAIILHRQRSSVVIVVAAVVQMVSGITLFASCLILFFKTFTATSQEQAIQTASNVDYSLIFKGLILALIVACLLSLAGAVLSIVRTVKSRKGRIMPNKLTVATVLTTVPSAIVFGLFAFIVVAAILSL